MPPAEQGQFSPTRAFVSYSQHDPALHSARVLAFAQALAADGLDVELDQYHQHEAVDWPRWCEERLRPENSDFVLMICSAEYKNRIEGRVAADKGRGVFWEGGIIDDYLYDSKANERFIPILLDDENEESLPRIVRGWTRFKVAAFGIASGDVGYTNLYRLLTAQPSVVKPKPGERKVLARERSPEPPFSGSVKPTNLPYPSLGPLFKGREGFINAIRASFAGNPGRVQAITARHAIHGLGGIGKTRAAVEYAWRFAADYTALLFVSAETPLDFHANVAALCPILKIAEGITDDTTRFEAAIDWLRDPHHCGWLFIADNLDTLEAAEEAGTTLATLDGGHVLVTGRLSEWPAFIESRRLDVLELDAATEFLLARTADKRQPTEDDAVEARSLAAELDGLALALEQAAAFVRRHTLSFADYLQRWRAADQRVRQWHDARTMQYERPLAATWQATIDVLPVAARSLLDLLAWLGPEPLPRFLFNHATAPGGLGEAFETKTDPRELLRTHSGDATAEPESAFVALRDLSLLQPAKGIRFANEGQLHRVVALITRERQSSEQQVESLFSALALLCAAAECDPQDVRSWPVWDPLRPHVKAAMGFADDRGIAQEMTPLMNRLALLLRTKALNDEAEALFRRALTINEIALGPEHPFVAASLNNLAELLHATNRIEEAEPLFRQALQLREKLFGSDNPVVGVSLNNLSQLLLATNRLEEARPLCLRALDIFAQSSGPEHPDVAIVLNNLGQILKASNEFEQAEPLLRRALEINEKTFGLEHPSVATVLNNLSTLLQATERLGDAEPLIRRALHINEKSFGPEHPAVATSLNNLAALLQVMNRPDEAESLLRRALDIHEKTFGSEHPAVATDLNNLGRSYLAANRLADAEATIRRVLVILLKFVRRTGHVHPNLSVALQNYAGLLGQMGSRPERILQRFDELGLEAGFEAQSFHDLLAEILN